MGFFILAGVRFPPEEPLAIRRWSVEIREGGPIEMQKCARCRRSSIVLYGSRNVDDGFCSGRTGRHRWSRFCVNVSVGSLLWSRAGKSFGAPPLLSARIPGDHQVLLCAHASQDWHLWRLCFYSLICCSLGQSPKCMHWKSVSTYVPWDSRRHVLCGPWTNNASTSCIRASFSSQRVSKPWSSTTLRAPLSTTSPPASTPARSRGAYLKL